jgi:hypothetical protein
MKKILPFIAAVLFMGSALPCLTLDLCCEADQEVCFCGPCVFCTPVIAAEKKTASFLPLTQVRGFPIKDQTVVSSDFFTDILRPPCS